MSEGQKKRITTKEIIKIPLLYLAMGFFWIYFSDRLVSAFVTDLEALRIVNTYKGWIYVFVTGVILYLLIARQYEKLREREGEILRSETKYRYIADHDLLTDLYNRHYFVEELRRLDVPENLPLTFIVGDINGIKLVNDSFGHATGDKIIRLVADSLRKCVGDGFVCRLGGDEFGILLKGKNDEYGEELIRRIKTEIAQIRLGALDVSVSFGYGTKHEPEDSMAEMIKKAEDAMYSRKTYESPGVRGKTIEAIVTTLHEKNKREEEHSRRVSELCEKIGRAMELSEDDVKQLRMVGLLHDIGKIGIPETVLNKEGSLAPEERLEIQKHPEIGYRILSTVNSLSELAEYVLAHHERLDGKGYPKGLSGDEIPLKACIIGVADAYDAMISYRTYRKSLTREEAIEELLRCSGTQFHPECVRALIEHVL